MGRDLSWPVCQRPCYRRVEKGFNSSAAYSGNRPNGRRCDNAGLVLW